MIRVTRFAGQPAYVRLIVSRERRSEGLAGPIAGGGSLEC